jgi:hypothetical protein
MKMRSFGVGKTFFYNLNRFRFFTRNKQMRVGSDAYRVQGEHIEQFLPQDLYNLNVSHRTNFEDLDKYPI